MSKNGLVVLFNGLAALTLLFLAAVPFVLYGPPREKTEQLPPKDLNLIAAGASDYTSRHPPQLLIDGTPEPWGSTETLDDTYFWLTFKEPFRAQVIKVSVFSPQLRQHIRDVSVVVSNAEGKRPKNWQVIPGRIGADGPFVEKVTVPPVADHKVVEIHLSPDYSGGQHFNTFGLAVFSSSRGYRRNYLGEGRGVYVREISVE